MTNNITQITLEKAFILTVRFRKSARNGTLKTFNHTNLYGSSKNY